MLTIKKNSKLTIISLLLVTFFDHFSINLITPVLVFVFFDQTSSLFAADTPIAVRSHWYGIATSLPFFAAMFTTLILSALSDSYGRKLILVIASLGAFFFAACSGLSVLTGSLIIMLLGKFTGGLCARCEPTALAAIADISKPNRKAINIGYLQICIAIGAVIGPVAGGYIAKLHFTELNFSAAFWLATFVAMLSTLTAVAMFKETYIIKLTPPSTLKDTIANFWTTDIKKLALILVLFQIAWSMYYQFFPPVLKQYFNFPPNKVGWFIGLIALWLIITTLIGIKLLKKNFTDEKILLLSAVSMLFGFGLTFLGFISPTNFLCQILIWIGSVFIPAGDVAAYCVLVALLSENVSDNSQGKIMGLCFVLVYSAWGLTSLTAGFLGGIHITLPILLAPISLIVLFKALPKQITTKKRD